MKQVVPILVMVGAVLVLGLGWWYERSLFTVQPGEVQVSTSTTTVTAAQVTSSATIATTYISSLKINGKIPVTANDVNRQTNAHALFESAQ